MGTPRDMRAAQWARRRAKYDRWIAELRQQGVDVQVPDRWEKPPHQRLTPGDVIGWMYVVGEGAPEDIVICLDTEL
jgi:heme oxygenase